MSNIPESLHHFDNLDIMDPQTRAVYFEALEKWLRDAEAHQHLSVVSRFLFSKYQLLHSYHQLINLQASRRVRSSTTQNLTPDAAVGTGHPPGSSLHRRQTTDHRGPGPTPAIEGIQCRIPPVWKRLVAEMVDFLILFFIKLFITFVAVDFFNIVNMEQYGIKVMDSDGYINYKSLLAATSEILILEFIHRIVVCSFEAYFLWKGSGGTIGGATPGKALMGLRVVTCRKVDQVDNQPNEVLVQPGTDLGLLGSISRAILKNIVLALLFPICFVIFFFKHNRTGYDVVCKSIVVEGCRRRP